MIVTVTPNPSLDRTLEVQTLHPGAVHRAHTVRVDPGGKGINVARALRASGTAVRAVVPAGGHDGDHLLDALAALGIEVTAVRTTGAVRTNVSIVEPDGTVTKVNAPGNRLTERELATLVDHAVAALDAHLGATWLAGCGSLPPGAPDDWYAHLTRRGHAAGAQVAIDASDVAFLAALPAGPDLVKPNADELADATGRAITTLGEVLDGARMLRARGAGTVVVSLGADGAVLVSDDGAWHATTPPIIPRSAVGAGDALVAGLLSTGQLGPEALRTGVAFGTAAALLPGTQLPGPDDLDLDRIAIEEVDPTVHLTEPGGNR